MTAITTVPGERRARWTPYLLAVLAGLVAVAAWLLLGTHTALASERSAPHRAGGERPSVTASQIHHREEPGERRAGQAHDNLRSVPGALARSSAEHRSTTAQPATERRPAYQRPAAQVANFREVTSVPVTEHHGRSARTAEPARPFEPEPAAAPAMQQDEPARHRDDAAQPGQAASTQGSAAHQPEPAHKPGCAPRPGTHEGQASSPHHRAIPFPPQPGPVARTRGIALVATPSRAVAPVFALSPPVTSLRVPAAVLPAGPTLPIQAAPPPFLRPAASPAANPATAPSPKPNSSVSPLATRLQSAVTAGALWLLVPLLLVVLVLQLRLMHQLQSLAAQGRPATPTPRHYWVTQDEVRALAPDMLPALAHHRFCESRRHQGRWRPAKWLELEETGSDVPLMWATCDTCHHERMTRLRSGGELAVST